MGTYLSRAGHPSGRTSRRLPPVSPVFALVSSRLWRDRRAVAPSRGAGRDRPRRSRTTIRSGRCIEAAESIPIDQPNISRVARPLSRAVSCASPRCAYVICVCDPARTISSRDYKWIEIYKYQSGSTCSGSSNAVRVRRHDSALKSLIHRTRRTRDTRRDDE